MKHLIKLILILCSFSVNADILFYAYVGNPQKPARVNLTNESCHKELKGTLMSYFVSPTGTVIPGCWKFIKDPVSGLTILISFDDGDIMNYSLDTFYTTEEGKKFIDYLLGDKINT